MQALFLDWASWFASALANSFTELTYWQTCSIALFLLLLHEQIHELIVGFKIKASCDNLSLELTHETFEKRDYFICLTNTGNRMLPRISTAAKQKQTLNKIMYVTTACYIRKLSTGLFFLRTAIFAFSYCLFLTVG